MIEPLGLGARWARQLVCSATGATAPLDQPAFLSPSGAPWLVEYGLDRTRGPAWKAALRSRPWSLWRYRELLPVADFERRIDLGEGGTPLIDAARLAPAEIVLWIKEEGGNPTRSFKARGLSLAVNLARDLGAPGVELASAGNAGMALAAYAAAAGLPSRVALPEDSPPIFANRCREHGAEVLTAPGTLVEAAARLAERQDGFWNLSTLREPYRIEGKKTMALELVEQLDWQVPDWILYPTGGGTGIIGMHKAFEELRQLGLLGPKRPRWVAVQMAGCARLQPAIEQGLDRAPAWPNPNTRVWGLRVPKALGDPLILKALRESDGLLYVADEARLPEATARAAKRLGLRFSPEGAACLVAFDDLVAKGTIRPGESVVLVQTGDPANYE